MKDEHAKDVAQDVAEDVLGAAKNGSVDVFIVTCVVHRYRGAGQDVAQDLAFWGPGGARPHRHATTTAAAVFAQLAVC